MATSYSPLQLLKLGSKLSRLFLYKFSSDILEMKSRDSDNFLCSYPKSGTTFTQQICALLLFDDYRNDQGNSKELTYYGFLENQRLYQVIPFLEADGVKTLEDYPNPRTIKTHVRYKDIPKNDRAKYIFVIRNPKDVLVRYSLDSFIVFSSYYHHYKHFRNVYEWKNCNIEDFFERFITGKIGYGCYFEYLLSWLPHLNDKDVLFLK